MGLERLLLLQGLERGVHVHRYLAGYLRRWRARLQQLRYSLCGQMRLYRLLVGAVEVMLELVPCYSGVFWQRLRWPGLFCEEI